MCVCVCTCENPQHIPVHILAAKIGSLIISALFTAHVLSGCDVTSKIGTTQSALKNITDEIITFAVHENLTAHSLTLEKEKYLISH